MREWSSDICNLALDQIWVWQMVQAHTHSHGRLSVVAGWHEEKVPEYIMLRFVVVPHSAR